MPQLKIKPVKEIPTHLIQGFVNELSSNRRYLNKPAECSVKMVAFKGETPIGFAVANESKKGSELHLVCPIIYIKKGHRREGIGRELIKAVGKDAQVKGISNLQIKQMLYGTKKLAESLKRENKWKVKIEQTGKHHNAHIQLSKRKK
jgi:GNAT superfamily N-acetyltransferase